MRDAPTSQWTAEVSSYLIGLVGTTAAVLVRWLLDLLLATSSLIITLSGAVAIAVWYGCDRPA